MGIFWNYLTGGNVKVATHQVADLHYRLGEDYLLVKAAIYDRISSGRPINDSCFQYFQTNSIRNYTELVCAQLNALAAPKGTLITTTLAQFKVEVAKYLRQRGISEMLISGNNCGITRP